MNTMSKLLFSLLIVMLAAANVHTSSAKGNEPIFQPTILMDGITVQGQLEGEYTAVLYGFNASQGDMVEISMNPITDGLDTYLVLIGQNAELLTFDDDSGEDAGGAMDSSLIQGYELPYDGSYYVIATTYYHIDSMSGEVSPLMVTVDFEITVNGITPPADLPGFDPNVTTFAAQMPGSGSELNLELTADQPIAYLAFDGAAGEVLNINIRSETPQPTPIIHLFALDGRRLAMNQVLDGDSRIANLDNLELPMDGRYLLMTMDVFFMDRVEYPDTDYGLGALYATIE